VLIPDDTSHEAKSRKFTPLKILIFIFIYTVFFIIVGYYFLVISGLGNNILPGKYVRSPNEVENIKELNEKMIFLAKELQLLKSANERLKYALVLGDSVLVDSIQVNQDTLANYYKSPVEGSLLNTIMDIAKYFFIQDDRSIFFIFPVEGYISRGFEPKRGHYGIDFVVKDGTPVFASAGGFVVFSGYTNDYGHTLILCHSEGFISIYKHCSVLLKKEREFIIQGDLIAKSGNSGLATTGPHLHFEIWHNGKAIDPETVLIKNN